MENFETLISDSRVLESLRQGQEVVWINPDKRCLEQSMQGCELNQSDIDDAEQRLFRFAPLIQAYFPETQPQGGLIESPLVAIDAMQACLNRKYGSVQTGKLLLKKDSHLAIAGSVKARGGIYEVLKHAEDLVLRHHLLEPGESYAKMGDPDKKAFFRAYTIQVGSTGNLGLSIGIISAVLGYHVVVHMSADAKQWKKDLLRSYGVDVREYEGDYSEAVRNGRMLSDADPKSYFVDDENSRNLFLGYAVAGKRLKQQLDEMEIVVDQDHPLFVYIPCGVGGAPGGITFGLKQVFGDDVHCFFVEPTQAPCMLLGLATGLNNKISVQDIGLSGETQADGLAVGRPSAFVGGIMKTMLSGACTVADEKLYRYMKDMMDTEGIFLEPSACAAVHGAVCMNTESETRRYLEDNQLVSRMANATQIVWATGGGLVPQTIRDDYMRTAAELEKDS